PAPVPGTTTSTCGLTVREHYTMVRPSRWDRPTGPSCVARIRKGGLNASWVDCRQAVGARVCIVALMAGFAVLGFLAATALLRHNDLDASAQAWIIGGAIGALCLSMFARIFRVFGHVADEVGGVLIAVLLALVLSVAIRTLLVQAFQIPSGAMLPTI